MAVPQKKTSKSKNGMRQAGKGFVKKVNVYIDAEGQMQVFHHTLRKKVAKAKENTDQERS